MMTRRRIVFTSEISTDLGDLDCLVGLPEAILPAAALRPANPYPVGGPITGTGKMDVVHKTLHEKRPVAVAPPSPTRGRPDWRSGRSAGPETGSCSPPCAGSPAAAPPSSHPCSDSIRYPPKARGRAGVRESLSRSRPAYAPGRSPGAGPVPEAHPPGRARPPDRPPPPPTASSSRSAFRQPWRWAWPRPSWKSNSSHRKSANSVRWTNSPPLLSNPVNYAMAVLADFLYPPVTFVLRQTLYLQSPLRQADAFTPYTNLRPPAKKHRPRAVLFIYGAKPPYSPNMPS